MEFFILLIAVLSILHVWCKRLSDVVHTLHLALKTKNLKKAKPIFEILLLFGFDVLVAIAALMIFGTTKSNLALKMIVYLNALTTIFGSHYLKKYITKKELKK